MDRTESKSKKTYNGIVVWNWQKAQSVCYWLKNQLLLTGIRFDRVKNYVLLILFIFSGYGNVIAQLDYGPKDAPIVTIGNQTWMVKNLNVVTFANGDTIPQAKTDEEWKRASDNQKPAWCYYDNDPSNDSKYGKLYNWFAVNDKRSLAPKGWHVPSDAEWTTLTKYCGGETTAGTVLKSTNRWESYFGVSGNGNNSSGFAALPAGNRNDDGAFYSIGKVGNWWSSSENFKDNSWYRLLGCTNNKVLRFNFVKGCGLSVRCIKD